MTNVPKNRILVIDTNVLIEDPSCIDKLGNNDIVIPMTVLEELDKLKIRGDNVAKSARRSIRRIEEAFNNNFGSQRVKLEQGGTLKISSFTGKLACGLIDDSPDNRILTVAYKTFHGDAQASLENFRLLSRDVNLRAKAGILGVPAEGYDANDVMRLNDELFMGSIEVETSDENAVELLDGNFASIENDLFPNEFISVKTPTGRCETVRLHTEGLIPKKLKNHYSAFGVKAKNIEQCMALDLLLDDSVNLVTLIGPSGTGKTLLAVAAGVERVIESKRYSKLIVTRPIQPVGRDIGFLPGTLQEKMEPWVAPIKDNLKVLFSNSQKKGKKGDSIESMDPYLAVMLERGTIEVEAISFIRGRSIPDSFIIVDEAQNLTVHELKTILTRAGHGTKIVLTGDIEQIDNSSVDAFNNGLAYAVEKFKDYDIAGHVTLVQGVRSDLATLASQIL